jgi:hypothetical protein
VRRPNTVLTEALNRLGWTAARLACELNGVLGPGYVARSTVADWLANGRTPHDPLPTVSAHVLAEALGTPMPVERLWGTDARPSGTWVGSDDGLPAVTAPGATVETAAQWLTHDGGTMTWDRRQFLAVTGAALTTPAIAYTAAPAPQAAPASSLRGPRITPAITDAIASSVDTVRHIDDAEGGDRATLHFAHQHFALIADYVRQGRFTSEATRTRTVNLWAQLAQTAGWMAMDAGRHGLAQRYYRTALTAAHESADRALGAHILGCMTYQAITRGHHRDALALANASITAAQTAPPAVRALASARHAHANAALGDLYGLRRSTDDARTHLTDPDAMTTRPPWLYWLTDLNVVTGQTLITAAFAGTPGATRLLDEADPLITGWLGTHAERTEDRDALLHGTWLARSYLRRDDIEQTLITGTSLLDYAATVRSSSVTSMLLDLETDLARRHDLKGHPGATQLRLDLRAVAVDKS